MRSKIRPSSDIQITIPIASNIAAESRVENIHSAITVSLDLLQGCELLAGMEQEFLSEGPHKDSERQIHSLHVPANEDKVVQGFTHLEEVPNIDLKIKNLEKAICL